VGDKMSMGALPGGSVVVQCRCATATAMHALLQGCPMLARGLTLAVD